MHLKVSDTAARGRLLNGNPSGNPNSGPRCGAKNRHGLPCRAPALKGKRRCRLHGGLSTGPKTAEGRERIRKAKTKHGRYSAATKAHRRRVVRFQWRPGMPFEGVTTIEE